MESHRGEDFASSQSGDLVKLRDAQRQILEAPATLLTAIRRVTSRSARETAGVDELIVIGDSDNWSLFEELAVMDLDQC